MAVVYTGTNLFACLCVYPELPEQHVCKEEEVLTDQQLCNQERNSSLDQEDPEPPEIKEEQEELCTSQEGEQLELKLIDSFSLAPTYEESDHSEPEAESDQQLLSNSSHVSESQNQKGGKHQDSGSSRNAESKPKKRRQKNRSDSNKAKNSDSSEIHCDTDTGKKSFKCDTCGKDFKFMSNLIRHLRVHTGERPYSCKECGKDFMQKNNLESHMRTHTGEMDHQRRLLDIVWKPEIKLHKTGE